VTTDRQGQRFLHRATHRLLCHHPAPHSPDLAVSCLNGTHTFSSHGGHKKECEGRAKEDSNRSLPTVAGSMERVCVCVCVCVYESYFEGN
jgi:hypothetical protein